MAYKALYRTYRPSTFEEVAGQQHIVKTIKNALKTGKLAHAYLFTGPRGTGKTTMAKLLAKALNCEEGIGCQCNECPNCQAINNGSHPDVLELDAASNNSVEDIRELIDKVKYGTSLGRYKVYIIDEVHMLSTGAFNALLKTLEEPPEHVIFVLATTEPHKILPTILSRCQRYDFTRLGDLDIKERIRTVLQEENIPFDEKAVNLIISLADGGMRDALSILDQVLRYSGDRLNEQDIMDVFAMESTEEKISLLKAIISSDSQEVLQKLNRYIAKGTDIKRLTDDLLTILKDVLIFKRSFAGDFLNILSLEQAKQMADLMTNNQVLEMIDDLLSAQKDFKYVPSINSLFQITLLKMTAVVDEPKPQVVEKPVEQKVEPKQETIKSVEVPSAPAITPEPIKPQSIIKEEKEPETISLFDESIRNVDLPKETLFIKGTLKEDAFQISDDLMIDIMVLSKKDIKNELNLKWSELKKLSNHPEFGKAATMLMDGHILVASNQTLILEYPLEKSAERINRAEIQKQLQAVLHMIFNKTLFVYAVDRNNSVRLQQNYMNRMQIGKLPKAESINIEIEVQK